MSAPVQEVVNRAGFTGVLCFIITSAAVAPATRTFATWDNTSILQPTLTITYA
jgi:hypothetical protein